MSKTVLNNDVAEPFIKKLIQDTYDKKIIWERQKIDTNVEVPKRFEVPLTTAHVDYHFQAEISEGVIVHFQHEKSLYFVWVVDQGEGFAYFSDGLYSMPNFVDGIFELSKAIFMVTHEDHTIVDEIEAYIKG